MDDTFLDDLDATALAARIRAGGLSASEVVDAAIARITDRDAALHAVIAEQFDAARDEARGPLPDGPFAGVPFLVKGLGAQVAGMATTRGSRLWTDDLAAADSTAVARFRAAGLIVLGLTNTPELGKNGTTEPVAHGPTHNPWRPGCSPGGSSGGSAAAVAGGYVPVAHGNDGGGSIRIPAAACGLFGLKPSRARVPNTPTLDGFAYPMGCTGALTRTVRDSAALLDVVAGPSVGDPFAAPTPTRRYVDEVGAPPGRLRVAYTDRTAAGERVDDELVAAVARMAALLEGLGHHVEETAFTYDLERQRNIMAVVMGVSGAAQIDRRLEQLGRPLADDDIEPFTRMMYDMAQGRTALDYYRALQDIEALAREVGAAFEGFDVLLTPTLAMPVPDHGYADTTRPETMAGAARFSAFTGIFNVTGQPAASVPCGLDGRGLPIGVQLVGRYGAEDLLIRLASQIEAAAPWPRVAPWPPPAPAQGAPRTS
ncbi:MAG: amidase [Actinobacteria bacterium]|nr:amidase [Actinomycetota bacterium]